jgi:hypothetical protein
MFKYTFPFTHARSEELQLAHDTVVTYEGRVTAWGPAIAICEVPFPTPNPCLVDGKGNCWMPGEAPEVDREPTDEELRELDERDFLESDDDYEDWLKAEEEADWARFVAEYQ